MSDKTIILTVTVFPFVKGKRKIVIAGAPEGEMPLAVTGTFQQLHELIDQVWLDLAGRKPQTVHAKSKPVALDSKPADGEADEAETSAAELVEAELVEAEPAEAEPVEAEAKLPRIEGDAPPEADPVQAAEARQAMVDGIADRLEAENG